MKNALNLLIGGLSIMLVALVVSGCAMDSPPATATSGQEVIAETLTSSCDGQDTAADSAASECDEGDASFSETGDVASRSKAAFAACLAVELGVRVTESCVNSCVSCVGGGILGPVYCGLCVACAGSTAVQVAKACRVFL